MVSIIMRSFNEGWALRETLPAIEAQEYKNWELIVIDSGSTDGSQELIRKANPRHFIQIKAAEYNPSRVMNQGMELSRGEFGIFINADATPQGKNWLRPLVEGLHDPQTAAVFGRQIPRPDCRAVYANDYERCFGEKRESANWEHFFSMVSSGLRKDIWVKRGFLEKMQYSEDDEYTRWCRAQGFRVVYCAESVVMHSHNYKVREAYKRSFGEAKALAAVWAHSPEEVNWPRTVLLGWLNDLRRDFAFCRRARRMKELPYAAHIRWQQRRARLAGFRVGWEHYRGKLSNSGPYGKEWEAPHPNPLPFRRGEGETIARSWGMQTLLGSEGEKVSAPLSRALQERRFTIDADEKLERRLGAICEEVLRGVQAIIPAQKLEAVVLGGGYGRGQGGVLKMDDGDLPYNDLEFYVFVKGNPVWHNRKHGKALGELGRRLSETAGLHVEFKIDSLERLRSNPNSMFSYDLVSAHRVVFGREDIFAGCEQHLDAGKIPLVEATRLLFNRCSGLLLVRELFGQRELSPEDKDFIGRNLAKAKLALGDALLTAFGEYHWDCRERHSRLMKLVRREEVHTEQKPQMNGSEAASFSWREIERLHAAGVEFKLHPQRHLSGRKILEAEHVQVSGLAARVWLWLEGRRLGRCFNSIHEYALSESGKCEEKPLWRNYLVSVKTFGGRALLDRGGRRYPRERLFNSLPLLLWNGEVEREPAVARHLRRQLLTRAKDWKGFVGAYKEIWPSFA